MTSQERKFVAYYRQFAKVKAANSLGTQKTKVSKFLQENKGKLIAEHTENESKFAKTRPALAAAIAVCKKNKAKLLIASLDKLNTDAAFSEVLLDDTKVNFVCVEFPIATREMLKMRMVFAELGSRKDWCENQCRIAKTQEAGRKAWITQTRDRLRSWQQVNSAKAVSFAERVAPTVRAILKKSRNAYTLREIGAAFVENGLETPRGNLEWSPTQVKHLLARIK